MNRLTTLSLASLLLFVLCAGPTSAQSRGLPAQTPVETPASDDSTEIEDEAENLEDAEVEEAGSEGPREDPSDAEQAEQAQETGEPQLPGPIRPPEGFQSVRLGMGMAEVKEKLKADPYFDFRGDPDVTMLNRPNESLIETTGLTFVDRAFFQFHEGKLYTIILMLDTERMDHFTMYTSLSEKYGDPTSLSPSEIVWDFDAIRLSLERPLAVKYVDKQVFASLLLANDRAESLNALSKDRFLDQF